MSTRFLRMGLSLFLLLTCLSVFGKKEKTMLAPIGCKTVEEDPTDLMSDTWVGTDALGRQMPLQDAVGPVKDGRHFDSDQDSSTGWHGYDFVVNKVPGKLMAFDGKGGWMAVADIPSAVSGNQMELSLPMDLLNLNGSKPSFDFKWADNCGELDDPMFLLGDTAPNRRFNYRFIWKR